MFNYNIINCLWQVMNLSIQAIFLCEQPEQSNMQATESDSLFHKSPLNLQDCCVIL